MKLLAFVEHSRTEPSNEQGHPGHPLYLKKTLTLVPMGSNAEVSGERSESAGLPG
jgi:hypothetical protein